MRSAILSYAPAGQWTYENESSVEQPQIVLWFGSPEVAADSNSYESLRRMFPDAVIAGCSTGGEILNDEVLDNSAVAAAVRFDKAEVRAVRENVVPGEDAKLLGRRIAQALATPDLRAVYILSDGLQVNGAALLDGLLPVLPEHVVVTGGLAGDGPNFVMTRVGLDEAPIEGVVAAIGIYGQSLRVGWGSAGGWDSFGPQRQITRSAGNVLYELDGAPVLELYKRYLGEAAAQLPGSALLFPLVIRPEPDSPYDIVRTIVGVNEEEQSLIFAGDIPEGWSAQLIRGVADNLVDGAIRAARQAGMDAAGNHDTLALLVSCIGRKLMMGQRISDEVEAVRDEWGPVPTIGFYSYGEICPHGFTGRCTLHNQTMTITLLRESA
jgi:hypothetical protein